jgi:hypothetical protein
MHLSPAADPRRVRLWAGIATALILLVGIGFCWRAGANWSLFDTSTRTEITHDLVVEKVQAVAKLVSSETTMRDVVVYENTWMGSTKRSLVVVTGRVLAGVNLERGTDVRIDHDAKRISITIPPAEILAVEVVNLRTYDERGGLWNPFRPEDRDAIQRQVRTQLESAGEQFGIVEHANESARLLLQTMLAQDGYTVDVEVRARPLTPATG